MAAQARDERGLSESTQWAVLFSLLMLLTLGIIQTGVYLHGRNVAQRAATAAVDSARGSFGSTDDAQQVAEGIALSGGLHGVVISISRGVTTVTVEVAGSAPTILNIASRIHETASAPLERVSQP
jgi:Flp pilus assembly protein TadG